MASSMSCISAKSVFAVSVESSFKNVDGYRKQEQKTAVIQASHFFIQLGHVVAPMNKLLHAYEINC